MTKRLHDLDLARIATLPSDEKLIQLRRIRDTRPILTYNPFRSCLGDILNIALGLFGPVAPVPWKNIRYAIEKRSNSPIEYSSNVAVARGLFEFTNSNKMAGRHHEFRGLPLGGGRKLAYWHPIVLGMNERTFVPYFDPRRQSARLWRDGCRFAFSVMHQHIRVLDPDFAEAKLVIFQFGDEIDGVRVPILRTDEGIMLYDFEELDFMVRETYELWDQVCQERSADARKKGGGGGGMFGDDAA